MKQYYIYRNNESHGPFNFEELKTQQIPKGTMVWFEGLEGWVKAGQIEDLKSLFILAPPPINSFTLGTYEGILNFRDIFETLKFDVNGQREFI